MPRPSKGPRLYLDPQRKTWCIRDGSQKTRLLFKEGERARADIALSEYIANGKSEKSALVYFLTAKADGYPIKIGVTQRRFERFASIQNACPYDLHLCGIVETTETFERQLHRRLREYRLRGEWFARCPEVVDLLTALCREKGGEFTLSS